jgi:hypothetical protein
MLVMGGEKSMTKNLRIASSAQTVLGSDDSDRYPKNSVTA